MLSTNEQCSLFLYPVDNDFILNENSVLTSLLRTIGFISKEIGSDETGPQKTSSEKNRSEKISLGTSRLRYFTGEKFLNYVSYMGCAPAIQFEASKDKPDFCFIEIHKYDSAKLINSNKQARAPHCPACNKPVKNWQQQSTTETIAKTILCNTCNTTSNIGSFDWRKMAGYAHLFIEITDIFPKEAIPQPTLLEHLEKSTETQWQYFYSCK